LTIQIAIIYAFSLSIMISFMIRFVIS